MIQNAAYVFILASFFPCFLSSQTSTVSPYSRYGVGDLHHNPFVQNVALGGLNIALQNDSTEPFHINFGNPASYNTRNRTIAFEAGATSLLVNLKNQQQSETVGSVSPSYLALSVPAARWWGIGIGLVPYSSVGYKITDEKKVDTTVQYIYEGSGGINRAFWGNSFRPFMNAEKGAFSLSNLTVGANLSYLFGKLENTRRVEFPRGSGYFNTRTSRAAVISDVYLDYGLQYGILIDSLGKRDLEEDVKINLGFTFAHNSNIHTESDLLSLTYVNNIYNLETVKDTLQDTTDRAGVITLPTSLGAGFTFRKGERWLAGAEFQTQKWSEFFFLGDSGRLKNSLRVSAGIQFIPDKGDRNNYFNRIQYRMGGRYERSYLELKNTRLMEYAFSIGFGFPGKWFMGQTIMINTAFEAGSRGTTGNNLIRENIFRAVLGLTFNSRWFDKRKYD